MVSEEKIFYWINLINLSLRINFIIINYMRIRKKLKNKSYKKLMSNKTMKIKNKLAN